MIYNIWVERKFRTGQTSDFVVVLCGIKWYENTDYITKSKMSPASIGGGFHLLFSARVTIPR